MAVNWQIKWVNEPNFMPPFVYFIERKQVDRFVFRVYPLGDIVAN